MKVLVTVASKHGSTLEIGQAIARALADRGISTDVRPVGEVDTLAGYDGVVVGSGVYAGQWLALARDFIQRSVGQLRERPVWLFSSGPTGHESAPIGDPAGVAALIDLVRPRGHRVFAGRMERRDLGVGEKLIVKVVRAQFGDFRDWSAIEAWAGEIAAELEAGVDRAPMPELAGSSGG